MDAPAEGHLDRVEDDPHTCTWCGRPLDTTDAVQVAFLREWSGDSEDAPWNEPWGGAESDVDDGTWRVRCVRAFCDTKHVRAWMAEGHPTATEWYREPTPPESSDLGCMLGCLVVLVMLACLVLLGVAEAWRILF